MIVMKFGGTSVGDADSIRRVRDIVMSHRDEKPIVVVSAVSGVTNSLVELCAAGAEQSAQLINTIQEQHIVLIRELWGEKQPSLENEVINTVAAIYEQAEQLSGRARADRLLSIGEILSSFIVSAFISEAISSRQVLATDLLVSDNTFGSAEIIDDETQHKIKTFKNALDETDEIPVVTGFIAATSDNQVTTLGRGGSDYSAALLGYYLQADEIQIWTDVDGVFSADPRRIKDARLISEITYQEAAELAAFGAKVLHPKTMRPAVYGGIPIRIANTFLPEAATTRIVAETERNNKVIAVAAKQRVMMVNVYAVEMLLERGFMARISSIFAKHNISIDIISASETSVSLTLDNHENIEDVISELDSFSSVSVHRSVGLVSIIGQGITSQPAILASVAENLEDMRVKLHMLSVGAQGINISMVIDSEQVDAVTEVLHRACIKDLQ